MTRRECLALGGVLLCDACRPPKGSGFAGYALIATSGENSVAVVDLTAFRLARSISVGAPPTAILPGGPANHTFVLTPSTGSVHVIDPNLQVIRTRKLDDELTQIRISPDGARLLAISAASRELIEADSISLRVLRRHKLVSEPVDLDVAADRYAAVSLGQHAAVELFHLDSGQRRSAGMSGRVGAIRFRGDGQQLLVADLHDQGLTALTVPALDAIAELPLAMRPENLCFNSDQGQLFVSGAGMDGVAIVFPYSPLIVEQTVLAGRDPGIMTCSETPPLLFVGSNSGSDVCILSIDTRKVIDVVDVGQRPTYITTTPDSQYALVLDKDAGMMAVIRIPAIRLDPAVVLKVKSPAAALFTMVPVGSGPVHAAVVPRTA